ncbi:2-oxo-4-hydroxy-4-carboxy-5-ureidoimidazoline decarboxylase [Actinomadura rubrisoli]|uniref:2-oxo-4-hydroxy-4-carboxy-5-ureidoimidazoline decarboxylase n=1 Tax=Actinomadura rubrisoli TaxID=2530368 RepID=A0A4V6PF35_9ACTN|nr:2-oxo-4-hydroxy-4-carboxy-5-ureidoimidazoline decarboxylase [Actinomadura rubrisoli]
MVARGLGATHEIPPVQGVTIRTSCASTPPRVPVSTACRRGDREARVTVERLNALSGERARDELLTCCASRRWADAVAAGRPYAGLEALRSASAAALADLDWGEVEKALAAHPRIGDRVRGGDREAAWSRGEQSGVDGAAAELRKALVEGNRAYEERFGHVFLICATGLSAAEMLAALRARLANDPGTEREVVRDELAKIVDLRLAKLLNGLGETGERA